MQKTANFNLNQWEASDPVCRADFNADNAAIDAALVQTNADLAAVGAANCLVKLGGPVTTTVANGTITFDLSGVNMADYAAMFLVTCIGHSGGSAYLYVNGVKMAEYGNSWSTQVGTMWFIPYGSTGVAVTAGGDPVKFTKDSTTGMTESVLWANIHTITISGESYAGARAVLYGLKG